MNITNKMIFYYSGYIGIFLNIKLLPLWLIIGAAMACAPAKRTVVGTIHSGTTVPDYENLNHWAAHPGKWDFSDSLPKPYRPMVQDTSIDVFFIHPTTFVGENEVNENLIAEMDVPAGWNADISNAEINRSTDKGSILYQASAFNQYRVFAPRYRQAHLKTFYIADSIARHIFDVAYQDIKNAFSHYLHYENQGRPFIIAAHSQGTLHGARLIKEMVEDNPIQQQLVAAYLIGLPVREDYFKTIPACVHPDSTGCIISWRTFKMGYEPPFVSKETFKAIVVNPLTWTVQTEKASRKLNKGAVLYNFNKPMKGNVSTIIHGNVLWSSKPRFFGNLFFTRKNYHVGDINLFWKDIRDNTAQRVAAYRQKSR